jgi:hypothetical protein
MEKHQATGIQIHMEMDLIKLNDDVLIAVFEYLDKKSRLQLMLVCKRFETLLSNTPKFNKEFEMNFRKEFFQDPKNIKAARKVRRNFGSVEINFVNFVNNQLHYQTVYKFFQNVGSSIDMLEIWYCRFTHLNFPALLYLARNITEFKNVNNIIYSTRYTSSGTQVYLSNLRKCVHSLYFFKNQEKFIVLPDSMDNLHILSEHPKKISINQKKIRVLKLSCSEVKDFKYNNENSDIKELKLKSLKFPEKKTFDSFTDFIKIQKSVKLAVFDIEKDEEDNQNDYSAILNHLLNLETLKYFKISYRDALKILPQLQITNPSVEFLFMDVDAMEVDFESFARFFPNITSLKINYKNLYESSEELRKKTIKDFSAMNGCQKLQKIKTNFITGSILGRIFIRDLRELHLELLSLYPHQWGLLDLDPWQKFVKRHKNLELLKMSYPVLGFEHLKLILEGLPRLQRLTLELKIVDEKTDETIQLLGKNTGKWYDRMKDLHISMDFDSTEDIDKKFKELFPNLEIRESSPGRFVMNKNSGCWNCYMDYMDHAPFERYD